MPLFCAVDLAILQFWTWNASAIQKKNEKVAANINKYGHTRGHDREEKFSEKAD